MHRQQRNNDIRLNRMKFCELSKNSPIEQSIIYISSSSPRIGQRNYKASERDCHFEVNPIFL